MQLALLYKCLGDESRLRILNILKLGIFNVQELTNLLALSQPTVSHHLKIMSQSDLVKSDRDGTHIYYSLNNEADQLSTIVIESVLKNCSYSAQAEDIFNSDQRNAKRLADERRSKTTNFFNKVAADWKELRSKALGQENFLDHAKKLIDDKDCVLDLGCGDGALLDILLPRAGTTIGIDCSESMLLECKKRLNSRSKLADLRLGYMEHLPVGDATIDKAVAYMSLHHVPNPPDALKEAARVIKVGGQLILVDLVKHDQEFMRTDFADIWLGFDKKQLNNWLLAAGFTNIDYQPVGKKNEVFVLTCNL